MKLIYLLLTLFMFFSCDEQDDNTPITNCNDNPLENVDWLKQLVDNENNTDATNSNGLEIIQYTYKGQTSFLVDNCINCSDNLTVLYDCEKNKLCEFGGIAGLNTCPDFEKEATDEKILFTTRASLINNTYCEKKTIIDGELYKTTKASPIKKVEIIHNCMEITFDLLSTQDRIADVTLIDQGVILESFPIQRNLKFSVAQNLTKPTVVTRTTSFDISNLVEWDYNDEIILNIEGFTSVRYQRVAQCGDPNVNCIARNQKEEAKVLAIMLKEIQQLSESAPCTDSKNWKFTEVGSKACGGPQLYLPYSTKINVENFLSKVKTYTAAENDFNRKWGIVSDCAISPAPTGVECLNGKATLIF